MRPLRKHWAICIDVTTRCTKSCAHCTRAIRHVGHEDTTLEFVETALRSLEGWPGGVIFIGGEPTIHKEFGALCLLMSTYVPRHRAGLFTLGGPEYDRYKHVIDETFGMLNYNDHQGAGGSLHAPILVDLDDLGISEDKQRDLSKHCWLQDQWCPCITPRGAFFCEVSATLDRLMDGPGGARVYPGWWKDWTPKMQADQTERYCRHCAIPLGLTPRLDVSKREQITQWWANKVSADGNYEIVGKEWYAQYLSEPKPYVRYSQPDGVHHWFRVPLGLRIRQKVLSLPGWLHRKLGW